MSDVAQFRQELETVQVQALAASIVYLACGLTLRYVNIFDIASLWFRESAKLAAIGCAIKIALDKFTEHGY